MLLRQVQAAGRGRRRSETHQQHAEQVAAIADGGGRVVVLLYAGLVDGGCRECAQAEAVDAEDGCDVRM